MAIYKHPKSGVYFADVTVDKVRHRASLETRKWQDALRLHKEFELLFGEKIEDEGEPN